MNANASDPVENEPIAASDEDTLEWSIESLEEELKNRNH